MKKKVFVAEEIEVEGQNAQRLSEATLIFDAKGDRWEWECPADFSEAAKKEWQRVMKKLSSVGGEDLRHVVCGVGLQDHCLGSVTINRYGRD